MYHRIMVAVTVAFAVAFVAYILIAGEPVDPTASQAISSTPSKLPPR
jgi:hypothetical protein